MKNPKSQIQNSKGKESKLNSQIQREGKSTTSDQGKKNRPAFAHRSEEKVAQLLDYYHLKWAYEPRSFPIEWDKEGNPKRYFTPDFYLTDYDLYIEVTVIRQKLITKKHRKIRHLRELYPEINIKLLNVNDLKKLMLKYNVEGEIK